MEMQPDKQIELAQTAATPGYKVLFDIGDKLFDELFLAPLMNLDRSKGAVTDAQILSAQDRASGARVFFELWQKEVHAQLMQLKLQMEAPAAGGEEEEQAEPIAEFRTDQELRKAEFKEA
jgi:hypothetical protein